MLHKYYKKYKLINTVLWGNIYIYICMCVCVCVSIFYKVLYLIF